jgi:hypothetical protein
MELGHRLHADGIVEAEELQAVQADLVNERHPGQADSRTNDLERRPQLRQHGADESNGIHVLTRARRICLLQYTPLQCSHGVFRMNQAALAKP